MYILNSEQITALLLAILAVGYTPGPANIFAMSCSMSHGWKASMKMWCGLFCGFLTAALAAALTAHLAGMAFKAYIPYLKYAAAVYLLYLAWKTLRSGISASSKDTAPTFWSGYVVQLTNAKMILLDLSCYSAFVLPHSERFVDLLPVTALLLLAGPGANLVWLLTGGLLRPFFDSHRKVMSGIMAGALALCAVMMVFV